MELQDIKEAFASFKEDMPEEDKGSTSLKIEVDGRHNNMYTKFWLSAEGWDEPSPSYQLTEFADQEELEETMQNQYMCLRSMVRHKRRERRVRRYF